MDQHRFVRSALLIGLAVAGPVPAGDARNDPARDLQAFARAYERGDLLGVASLFASPEPDQAYGHLDVFNRFRSMWLADSAPALLFRDVSVHDDGRVSAWFISTGPAGCYGLVEIDYQGDKWKSLNYECLATGPRLDGATLGQTADAASTAAALSTGAAEANPLAAGVLDAGGVPLLLGAKLALSKGVEHLDPADCRAWKDGLTSSGFAAAGWNLAVIAGAGSGVGAPLALFGAVLGYDLFHSGNAVQCRSQEKIDYKLITSEVIL